MSNIKDISSGSTPLGKFIIKLDKDSETLLRDANVLCQPSQNISDKSFNINRHNKVLFKNRIYLVSLSLNRVF